MVSVLSGNIKSPEIEYYVKEKKNAIAPKVTDNGATTIQQQVNSTFVEVASEAVVELMEDSTLNIIDGVEGIKSDITSKLHDVDMNLEEQQEKLEETKLM